MSEITSHKVEPGTVFQFHNQQDKPLVIKAVTVHGTECEAELHPGAVFKVVAGNEELNIFLQDTAQPYEGIRSVK